MNKDDFIKMMENGYKSLTREETLEEKSFRVGYEYALKDLFRILMNNDKEIERLKKSEKEALDTLESATYENINLTNEVDRLNNIINELEKYTGEDDWTSVNGEIAVRLIKLKLQELKGDGSNE